MLQTRSERQAKATRRWVVVYAVLLAICLTAIAFSNAGPIQELRRGFVFAVSPIQEALAGTTRTITSLAGAVGDIDQLRRDNQALTDRVSSLETQLQQLATLKTENERLANLLKVQAALQFETVAADVVARQATDQERILPLARGTDGGIAVNDPVLSEGGALVGVITEVGQNWSTAMLISDPRSVVIGLDEQTRATGEIVGRLEALLAGLDRRVAEATQMPVHIADDPLTCVARGTGVVLQDLDRMNRVLVSETYSRPPR